MRTKFVFSMIIAAIVILTPALLGQSSTAADHRIIESITINGQTENGVLILRNGNLQTPTCPSPEPYVTPDQSESGWACYEQQTGMWLLHAQPTSIAPAEQPPTVIYNEPNTVYVPSYSYSYPYPYPYPYNGYYPYYWGPAFGLGFGFGFGHGFHGNNFNGHAFHGNNFHGNSFGHGFNHGPGFRHGGGGFHGGGHMGGGHR